MAAPRIITARSINLQFRSNHSTMGPEHEVTGHYSGEARAADWQAGIAAARGYHEYHLGKGWAGIGYHYVIPDDGAIICCRPVNWSGAHVLNENNGRVGICMPGGPGQLPTHRQARSLNWLLHNAHTEALPRPHRTDNNLWPLPIRGHKEVPQQSTDCPGMFLSMYHQRGEPWHAGVSADTDDGFVDVSEKDRAQAQAPADPVEDDRASTGPDEEEARAKVDPAETGELPEADERFDEDLRGVVG
jgi:hypothetical protein